MPQPLPPNLDVVDGVIQQDEIKILCGITSARECASTKIFK
jgi:hypothetical protein